MSALENRRSQKGDPTDPLPLSLLNDYLYCPRRAALKVIEGWREANEHTARGDIIHEHADLPGYEVAKGVLLWRGLPVWSERLGLSGKCDIVEVHSNAERGARNAEQERFAPASGCDGVLVPVEYKKGRRRQFENDDAQLCAQALCLEEMFSSQIPRGAVFHAESKRRREVEFTSDLRASTERAIEELHAMISIANVPPAVFKPACEECSLFEVCLPKATARDNRAVRMCQALFKTD